MTCENCKNEFDCKECEKEAFKRLSEFGNASCSGYEPKTTPDKKRTERTEKHTSALDNEIKKALECCVIGDCDNCPYDEQTACKEYLLQDAINELNRLQAENEELKAKVIEHIKKSVAKRKYDRALIKADVYRSVLVLINEIVYNKYVYDSAGLEPNEKYAVIKCFNEITYRLNNILKELVGDNDAQTEKS